MEDLPAIADFSTAGDVHDVAGDEAGLGGNEEDAGVCDNIAIGALERMCCHEIIARYGLAILLTFLLRIDACPTTETNDTGEVNDHDGPIDKTNLHGIGFYESDEIDLG